MFIFSDVEEHSKVCQYTVTSPLCVVTDETKHTSENTS